jgi:hypothetical protein
MIWVLFCHWLGDFVFQNSWIALNKSRKSLVLGLHVLIYSVVLLIGCALLFGPAYGMLAVLGLVGANAGLHLVTDAITSRCSRHFLDTKQLTFFWWTIGFDQFLHVITLIILLDAFFGAGSAPYLCACFAIR